MTIVNSQPQAPSSNSCTQPPFSQQSSPGSGCPPPTTSTTGSSFTGSAPLTSNGGPSSVANGPSPSSSVPPISTTPGSVVPSGGPPTSSTGSGSHGPSPSNLSNCTCNVLPSIPPGAASNPPGGSAAALLSAAASQRASCPIHSHSPVGSMSGPPNVGGPLGPSGPVGTTSCGVPGSSCGPMGPVNISGPVGSPCGGLCGPGPCHPTPGGSPCGMPGPPGHMPPGMNAMGPGDPMFGPGPSKMPPGDPFYSSPFSPYYRRHAPYMASPEYRMYDMNKRLQQRTEESDNLWWDAFATEFFEDDATLSLSFCLEDGPKRYTIGRMLIPRYFRSIFEGGVTDLYFTLKHPKESFHQTSITLECDQTTMNTHHGKPKFIKVCTDGRLILEFTFDDLMRIRTWHFTVRCHSEFIQRSVIAMQQEPAMLEQLSKNITRQGITNYTLNYLRLCAILEPMQELMSRHKAYALNPRDCLKTTLFQKWQRMVAPPEQNRPANKRRKRKASTQAGAGGDIPAGTGRGRGKKGVPSPGPGIGGSFNLTAGDVMVVGEPTLMGGEFGDEDERLITRLENSQFDAAAAATAGLGGPDGSNGPDSGGSGASLNGPMGPMGSDHPGPHMGPGGSLGIVGRGGGGGSGGGLGGPSHHSFQGSPWGSPGSVNGPLNSIDKKPLIPGVNSPVETHSTPVSS